MVVTKKFISLLSIILLVVGCGGGSASEKDEDGTTPSPTPAPTPTPAPEPQADAPATATAPPEGSREQATETPQNTSKAAVNGAEIDPAAVLAGSLLRVTIQPRPNNNSETTPLDRPADSLLLRLWQRLSGRR